MLCGKIIIDFGDKNKSFLEIKIIIAFLTVTRGVYWIYIYNNMFYRSIKIILSSTLVYGKNIAYFGYKNQPFKEVKTAAANVTHINGTYLICIIFCGSVYKILETYVYNIS